MNVILPSFQIWDIPDPEELKVAQFLERIGRTCYKSEDKITDESAIRFVNMIKKHEHYAVLEHYLFTFAVDEEVYDHINNLDDETHRYMWVSSADLDGFKVYLLTTSAAVINRICNENKDVVVVKALGSALKSIAPCLAVYNGEVDPETVPQALSREGIPMLPLDIRIQHDFISTKIICDRGVSHEIVRHRPASYAQESTRYCNYSNGKYDGITVIKPFYLKEGTPACNAWYTAMKISEASYNAMINAGCTPQEARAVLPNSLKTEINVTARIPEWRNIFELRTSKAAHPQIREVMYPLFKELYKRYPEYFGDQYHIIEEGIKDGFISES